MVYVSAINMSLKSYIFYCMIKVDDGEYFQTLPENTIFLFLRPGELWRPAGTDSIRSGKTQSETISVCLRQKENDIFQYEFRYMILGSRDYWPRVIVCILNIFLINSYFIFWILRYC